ncbi:pantothenate kinase [Treponema bryantii]|uniref:Type III pantothenate kinase n=1 Tax=Treponema bryantii TaxID=163 RepID=A0A1I3HTY9_9SPIR|nr:type III pantothenate kinase [Treponema bryantii]SFI39238.1 pantothenate kinase [Treponema bryantii]
MILTIDVGNTSTACGLFEDDECVLRFRRATDINSSSDEIGIFLRSALRENGYDWQKIQKIGCCSVVPAVNHSLSRACVKYLGHEPLFIQAGIKTGLKLRYSNPKEIGADLIAAAMGAVAEYPDKNLIIIDMGTAITAELVSKNKEFLGGIIMPGLKISVDALAGGTANLTSVEIMKPEHVYGSSTTEAIQAGLYYGTAGAVKEFCYLFKKNVFHGEDTVIIGTGGFARSFEDYKLFDEIIPGLVLAGVKKALELN